VDFHEDHSNVLQPWSKDVSKFLEYIFSKSLIMKGGPGNLNFVFIFYLVRLWLGCIPKISFLACLEVPKTFVWWWWVVMVVGGDGGGWFRVNSVITFGLALA
jgi:hypothetical protein